MDRDTLIRLEKLNQLRLDEGQRNDILEFFAKQDKELETLNEIDTSEVERMVHVMPIMTVVRPDIEHKAFTRDELQRGAPETVDGYWQVPRLVE